MKWFSENKSISFALIIIIIIIVIIWFFVFKPYINDFGSIYPILESCEQIYKNKREAYSFVGDFFGGMLTPIFSFASLLLLLLTIYISIDNLKLTKKELEQTRKIFEEQTKVMNADLELTKKELEQTRKIFEEQMEVMSTEKFENTFFKMLDLLYSFLKEITESKKTITIDTIRPFEQRYNIELKQKYKYLYESCIKDNPQNNITISPISFASDIIQKMQNNKIKEQQEFLTNYELSKFFEFLFQILKLIKRNDSVIESQTYIGIIKSSLSDNIFRLLQIYSFAEKEGDYYYEYHCLVQKYFSDKAIQK